MKENIIIRNEEKRITKQLKRLQGKLFTIYMYPAV